MTSLKEKIKEEIYSALKKREEIKTSTLRMLNDAILKKEKEKRANLGKGGEVLNEEELIKKSQLTEEEIIDIISSELKKRKESVSIFEENKRMDLAEREKAEIEILQEYLPEQLSEEEIKNIVKEAIKKVGAEEIKDMGKVMAEIMPKVKGKADGSMVSQIVKDLLTIN